MSKQSRHGDMDGNAALVTASSSGLGRAAVDALAARGQTSLSTDGTRTPLDETVQELDGRHPSMVVGCAGDLTEPADVERLVERTTEEFGGLDHLVTSAGGPPSGEFLNMTDED